MRFRYTWTAKDWNEAREVGGPGSVRRSVQFFSVVSVIIPVTAAAGDILQDIRQHNMPLLSNSLLPVIGALISATLGLAMFKRFLQRRRHRLAFARPQGEWEATLNECGWQLVPLTDEPINHARLRRSERDRPSAGIVSARFHPWNLVKSARFGDGTGVLVLQCDTGFAAIPTSSLTPEQGGHLYRLLERKLRNVESPRFLAAHA